MVKKMLYGAWALMFVLCAGLGLIPELDGPVRGVLAGLAVLSFLPPAWIVYDGWKTGVLESVRLVRNLAAVSLLLTFILLLLNILSMGAPTWVGDVLYTILAVVSTPMFCGQYWILSLLLWASLMWSCILLIRREKQKRK